MAITWELPLTNSKGLAKVLYFYGLRFPAIIAPALLDEPLLTAQPFYYLEQLEAVARSRFESDADFPPADTEQELERAIEYVVDNYLFEYSRKNPHSMMTTKLHIPRYWDDDADYHYHRFDSRSTECLTLDFLNDTSILECRDLNHPGRKAWVNWSLLKDYIYPALDEYSKTIKRAAELTVHVTTNDHPALGTGNHALPIACLYGQLLTFEQAEMLDVINVRDVSRASSRLTVTRGAPSPPSFDLPVETFEATSYHDSELLAYYFCAVRDPSPIAQFRNLYNVIEHFFDIAPEELGVNATIERQQIVAVYRWILNQDIFRRAFASLPQSVRDRMALSRQTSASDSIEGFQLTSDDIIRSYAERLYRIRNACIHSKRTRGKMPTSRFVPATADEDIVRDEIPLLQWVATLCISKTARREDDACT